MKFLDYLLRGGEYYLTFIFLLWLVNPITDQNEMASGICGMLSDISFILFVVSIWRLWKTHKISVWDKWNETPNAIFMIMISVVGIITGYAMNITSDIIFWSFWLSAEIIGVIIGKWTSKRVHG